MADSGSSDDGLNLSLGGSDVTDVEDSSNVSVGDDAGTDEYEVEEVRVPQNSPALYEDLELIKSILPDKPRSQVLEQLQLYEGQVDRVERVLNDFFNLDSSKAMRFTEEEEVEPTNKRAKLDSSQPPSGASNYADVLPSTSKAPSAQPLPSTSGDLHSGHSLSPVTDECSISTEPIPSTSREPLPVVVNGISMPLDDVVPEENVAVPGPSSLGEAALPSTSADTNQLAQSLPLRDPSMTPEEEAHLQLSAIFPDCDGDWLKVKIAEFQQQMNGIERLTEEMLERRITYPKVKTRAPILPLQPKQKKSWGTDYASLTVDDFYEYCDDISPLDFFYDPERDPSERNPSGVYRGWILYHLLKMFPYLSKAIITQEHRKHKNLVTSVQACKAARDSKKGLRRTKRPMTECEPSKPETDDEDYLLEVAFLRLENDIKNRKESKADVRNREVEQARASGTFLECDICCENELILMDMYPCADAHLFCQSCVRNHISTLIGQGKVEFPCLNPECDAGYPVETLKPLLKQAQFSRLLQRCATQAVITAGIPNLVQCPFCDFATIMDNPNDRVFTCLNPECSRESCRLCKEPNHVPLRCEEVEKDAEVKARTLVEEKMSEALMRECWQCKKKFLKEEGCNKMTCPCGAKMCYLCREPVKDYSHFSDNDPKKCPLWTDSRVVHAKDVASAATQAKEELKSKGQPIDLKFDPTQDLPSAPPDVVAREEARRREQLDFDRRFQELQRNFRDQGARALEIVDEALGLAAGPVLQAGLNPQVRGNVRAQQRPEQQRFVPQDGHRPPHVRPRVPRP